jgi:glutamate-ammonia-ligase adenylyltransferase
MQHPSIINAINAIPVELRDSVARWFERLASTHGDVELPADTIQRIARLVSCSEFAASVLLKEWPWFVACHAALDSIPDRAELGRLVDEVRNSIEDIDVAKERIRRFRQRWMLQILWREIAGIATLGETLTALSDLADRFLDAAAGFAERSLHERFGVVRDSNGEPVSLVILGMGKLGGRELNFSSDIDLIFLYPGGKESDGPKRLSAQEFFTRASRHIVALLDEITADGFAFRIDTRLRPFGDSGPPVTSFSALESYLPQHGRDWERYAYVKARIVGPAPPAAVASSLQDDLITPFVYRRYLDFGVFESLRDMHELVAVEVQRREMADNVKLGPGGIREIEFIVQSLQLVRGGARRELQDRELQRVLPKLVGRHGLEAADADALAEAYCYLRRVENFIQAIRDQQTHDLPSADIDQARLCMAMGHSNWDDLRVELDNYRNRVTNEFEAIAFRNHDESDEKPVQRLAGLWKSGAEASAWAEYLEQDGFAHADEIAATITEFARAPSTRQIDAFARKRLQIFIPELLTRIRESTEPVTTLVRVLALVEKVVRRSAYIALLNENAQVLARLVELCARSAYIADEIARYPVLLDELLDPSIRSSPLTPMELDAELRDRLGECPADDSEAQMAALGQFQRANMFRVAIADVAGNLPIMKVSDSLTWLAEAVLKCTLHIAWRDLTDKHGVPEYVIDGERRQAGFAIIAYGKLGGLEMSYGSDLDLVFLHDAAGTERITNGPRPLDNTMFYTRLVRRLSHFLTAQTGSGMLYEVDTRLRPDGQSGVMVSSVDAFEHYQEENAWTWEHQALLRARPVAGSERIAESFVRIRADTLSSRVRQDTLRADVVDMRGRMRKKLDKSNEQVFDLKQGIGGIGDIEFIVQYLVLSNAATNASVYFYTDNIRQLDALAETNCITADVAKRLQDIYKDYRLRLHHLSLDDKKPLVGQAEFLGERRFVEDLWAEVL